MFAYTRAGLSSPTALFMLFGSLIGSYVNIPLFYLQSRPVASNEVIDFFGMQYVVPIAEWRGTIVAVNVGGCVIPVLISLYILINFDFWVLGAVATAIVAVITQSLATPVQVSASHCRFSCRRSSPPSSRCCSRVPMPARSPMSAAVSAC